MGLYTLGDAELAFFADIDQTATALMAHSRKL